MYQTYVNELLLPSDGAETKFIMDQVRTCYNGIYPFKIFPDKGLRCLEFAPITILYGGNGSGKSTLLNVLAEKAGLIRHSAFNKSAFFGEYIRRCQLYSSRIPEHSQILTSDDVSDYLLNIRYLNDGIDVRREELFQEYIDLKYSKRNLRSLSEYDEWKKSADLKSKSMTQSRYVRERLMRNVDMTSNGESAIKYFVEHITQDALYLLDEPENSLSIELQQELSTYITASAEHFHCQFIIATHSPILLSMDGAVIYDLDEYPIKTKPWTELDNVRKYFDFFEMHRAEFLQE